MSEQQDARIERLEAALRQIRDARPWQGAGCEWDADYGSGHDAARESAADIAREALEAGE